MQTESRNCLYLSVRRRDFALLDELMRFQASVSSGKEISDYLSLLLVVNYSPNLEVPQSQLSLTFTTVKSKNGLWLQWTEESHLTLLRLQRDLTLKSSSFLNTDISIVQPPIPSQLPLLSLTTRPVLESLRNYIETNHAHPYIKQWLADPNQTMTVVFDQLHLSQQQTVTMIKFLPQTPPTPSKEYQAYLNSCLQDALPKTDKNMVFILRGIPGSGKSSLVKAIRSYLNITREDEVQVCSADLYFQTKKGYYYDRSKIRNAHQQCQNQFAQAVERNIRYVIVDNTHSTFREYKYYLDICRNFQSYYDVRILEIDCWDAFTAVQMAERNSHGVETKIVLQMFSRWTFDQNAVVIQPFAITPPLRFMESYMSRPNNSCLRLSGVFFSTSVRETILQAFPPKFKQTFADHVTLHFRPTWDVVRRMPLGKTCVIRPLELVYDSQCEALVVLIEDSHVSSFSFNDVAHITLSAKHGTPASYSNELLSSRWAKRVKLSNHNGFIGIVGLGISLYGRFYTIVDLYDDYPDCQSGIKSTENLLKQSYLSLKKKGCYTFFLFSGIEIIKMFNNPATIERLCMMILDCTANAIGNFAAIVVKDDGNVKVKEYLLTILNMVNIKNVVLHFVPSRQSIAEYWLLKFGCMMSNQSTDSKFSFVVARDIKVMKLLENVQPVLKKMDFSFQFIRMLIEEELNHLSTNCLASAFYGLNRLQLPSKLQLIEMCIFDISKFIERLDNEAIICREFSDTIGARSRNIDLVLLNVYVSERFQAEAFGGFQKIKEDLFEKFDLLYESQFDVNCPVIKMIQFTYQNSNTFQLDFHCLSDVDKREDTLEAMALYNSNRYYGILAEVLALLFESHRTVPFLPEKKKRILPSLLVTLFLQNRDPSTNGSFGENSEVVILYELVEFFLEWTSTKWVSFLSKLYGSCQTMDFIAKVAEVMQTEMQFLIVEMKEFMRDKEKSSPWGLLLRAFKWRRTNPFLKGFIVELTVNELPDKLVSIKRISYGCKLLIENMKKEKLLVENVGANVIEVSTEQENVDHNSIEQVLNKCVHELINNIQIDVCIIYKF